MGTGMWVEFWLRFLGQVLGQIFGSTFVIYKGNVFVGCLGTFFSCAYTKSRPWFGKSLKVSRKEQTVAAIGAYVMMNAPVGSVIKSFRGIDFP
jgi:hypothetical protein